MQPMTPLRPLMQASVKPPSPMLAPKQHPLKPATPIQAKNAPKTPNSHPQRRYRFQMRLVQRPQRRQRFQTTTPPGLLGLTGVPTGSVGSDRHTFACNSFANASCFEVQSLKFRAFHSETERRREGIACDIECLSIGAHYVVEMGGIEPLSLCGAEHHKCSSCGGCRRDRKARLRRPWAVAGPGCGGRGRWRGLAGLRDDAPSEARSADGERAGHRPRAHKAARPDKSGPPAPETPVGPQATTAGRPPPTGTQSSPTRHTTRSRPAPSGPGGTRVRRQLSEAADQPTLHVAPSRPSATVTPAAARRSRSSSARAQSLAARAAARSSRTA